MSSAMDIVNSYVAVWNEGNPAERRRRIERVWTSEGTSCFRLLDAHGHGAIEGRVTSSWEKWLSDGKYKFRPKSAVGHHDTIRCEWEMIRLQDGAVEANGLSFLLLDPNGKLRHDYQFNPDVDDAPEVTDRYLSVLNGTGSAGRFPGIASLWAEDAVIFSPDGVANGYAEIDAAINRLRTRVLDAKLDFSPAGRSQAHHNLARIAWSVRTDDGRRVLSARTHLLIFDNSDRILRDYQFDDEA